MGVADGVRIDVRVDSVENVINKVDIRVDAIDIGVDPVDNVFNKVDTRVDAVDVRVEIVEENRAPAAAQTGGTMCFFFWCASLFAA